MEKLLGKKLYMTSVFDENRRQVPVTAIELGPCIVTQLKTEKIDGYNAVQVGYSKTKEKHLTKAQIGHLKKSNSELLRSLLEFRTEKLDDYALGDSLSVDRFAEGEFVAVSGVSKGKGFAGTIKRHNFHRGPKTHGGQSALRSPGSIGAASYPARVLKGKKMPGRMGGDRKTIKNLEVIKIDKENNILMVKGSIPGGRNSIVEVARG